MICPNKGKGIELKIGIICYPTFGGSGIIGTELGLELMKKGHEVHFISYRLPERLKQESDYIFHEVDILSYPLFKYPPHTILLASKVVNLIEQEKLELIHAHYAIPHSTSLFLAKMSRPEIKIISTLHGTDVHLLGLDATYKPILESSLNGHDALTTVSRFMVNFIKDHYHLTKDVRMIYNFVNFEKFGTKKIPHDEIVFMHVSNFRKVKRSPDIVKAFARLARDVPNVKLEMIGEGPELQYCQDLALSLKIKDKVTFHGSLLNVPRVLCKTDVFVIPSEIESFGLAALEAMACRIPVIASTAGGLPEVVENGVAGLLIEPGNVDQLYLAMKRLATDEKLRKQMGKKARKIAMERFHPDKIIPQYEKLYEEVLSG